MSNFNLQETFIHCKVYYLLPPLLLPPDAGLLPPPDDPPEDGLLPPDDGLETEGLLPPDDGLEIAGLLPDEGAGLLTDGVLLVTGAGLAEGLAVVLPERLSGRL